MFVFNLKQKDRAGCKENQFSSLQFRQAVAMM